MADQEKVYVGSGKLFGKYDQIKIGLRAKELPEPNERGYINLIVAPRREPDKNGNTHSVYVDTWKPDSTQPRRSSSHESADEGSAPF